MCKIRPSTVTSDAPISEAQGTAAPFDSKCQVNNALIDFYRCQQLQAVVSPDKDSRQAECSHSGETMSNGLPECSGLVDSLRLERYSEQSPSGTGALLASEAFEISIIG